MAVTNRKSGAASKSGATKATKKQTGRDLAGKYIDVYVRMEEDSEKDYCFNVPADQPVSWLFKIFEVIPVRMSPSYFYYDKPDGFAVSVHPGYLTGEGAILFTDDAHADKWLKPISADALIGEAVVEGQLIVPHWKPNNSRWMGVVLFLMGWLYLDLPEFISPTPGTAPSSFLFWLIEEYLPTPKKAQSDFFNQPPWQCLFFSFHVVKVLLFYLILWNGSWHPSTLNPFSPSRYHAKQKPPTADQLQSIGWTGTHRTSTSKWHQLYLNYRTDSSGGVVEAYKKGLLSRPLGYELYPGEGWNVLKDKSLSDVKVQSDLLDEEGKFVVSQEYFVELSSELVKFLNTKGASEDETIHKIKEFREHGYLEGPQTLRELFTDLIPMHSPKK